MFPGAKLPGRRQTQFVIAPDSGKGLADITCRNYREEQTMINIFGVALFVFGVVLLVMGFSAADSIGSSFSRFFTGHPTDKSLWLMLGGVACILLSGGGFMVRRGRSNRA